MNKFLRVKNVQNAIVIYAARNGWFISSTWLFYWLLFFNYSEIGIVDAITVLVAFILEIPFGALADLIGRRKVLIGAYIAMVVGPLLQATAQSQLPIAIGNILFYIGFSAQSGAFDAIVYDSLKEEKLEHEYPKYYSTAMTIGWIVNGLCLIVGGLTANINHRIPFFLWAGFYAIGLIFAFRLKEPLIRDRKNISFKIYLKQNIDGVKELFSKYLRKFLPFILFVMGFVYFYDWSFLRPAIGKTNGLDGLAQSLIYAFSAIPSALVMQTVPFFKKHLSDKWGAVIICMLLAMSYFLFGIQLGYWAIMPLIFLSVISTLAYSWMTIIINDNVDTAHRATAVSGMYTLLKIPYILLAIVAGQIIDNGNISGLNFGIAATIFVAGITLIVQKFKKA